MSFSAKSSSSVGQMGVIISQSGNHSPRKWAEHCADRIVHIRPTLDTARNHLAQRTKEAIVEALVNHHELMQLQVQNQLKVYPDQQFVGERLFDPNPYHIFAIRHVLSIVEGTPWESQFKESADNIQHVIGQSLVDLAHLERLVYADNHPEYQPGQNYKVRYTPHMTEIH